VAAEWSFFQISGIKNTKNSTHWYLVGKICSACLRSRMKNLLKYILIFFAYLPNEMYADYDLSLYFAFLQINYSKISFYVHISHPNINISRAPNAVM